MSRLLCQAMKRWQYLFKTFELILFLWQQKEQEPKQLNQK
jgi:hypothetical protein